MVPSHRACPPSRLKTTVMNFRICNICHWTENYLSSKHTFLSGVDLEIFSHASRGNTLKVKHTGKKQKTNQDIRKFIFLFMFMIVFVFLSVGAGDSSPGELYIM